MPCTKRKYLTARKAKKALKAARCGGLKEYYHCRECYLAGKGDIWHLTSNRNYIPASMRKEDDPWTE